MKFFKKLLKWMVIIALFVIVAILGSVYYIYSGLSDMSEAKFKFSSTYDTIPFYFSNSGHMLIDVKFGKESNTYPFILDSGASNTIFARFADDFDLEDNGYLPSIGSLGNFFWSEVKEIDRLKLGNLAFTDLNFQVSSISGQCIEAYGIIGIGVMRHLVWQIDFEEQILIVTKELSDQTIASSDLKFDLDQNPYGHQLYIPVHLSKGKKNIDVCVDLGSSGYLSLDENLILRDSLKLKSKTIFGEGSGGLGEQKEAVAQEKIYLMDTLKFSDTDFQINNLPINSQKGHLDLLGLGFFRKFKTTISWRDNRLILSPIDSLDFMPKIIGFNMNFEEESKETFISTVIKNSPAQKAGIQLDQKVIDINGIAIKNSDDFCKARSALQKDKIIDVHIKDNNMSKHYKVKEEYLFELN
ncbi:PDZ domain-containing protein [Zunongwangia endophytica]|uniref:PDZ domain-containing protein n=1 Tax=Zunongwangia endophytica TaxID=1808945 RepID=A0ABV8H350_9FLAO|nr:PDZ domain-containing protein [Zunongwangia endophytica]MDN3595990.1 PDZ domain-containing protein [Zunongwangia endophytica]